MIIDVVIPAYNESERIVPTLKSYAEVLAAWDSRILVVDDGSQDGTVDVVNQLASELPVPVSCLSLAQNSGKGCAVREGFKASRKDADAVFFVDADGSTPAKEFSNLVSHWQQGADVVIGSRALGTENIKQHWLRRSMGQTFNRLFRLLIPVSFGDTQCGFKLFSQKTIPSIIEKSLIDGFAFDIEWILIAQTNGFQVKEVPVWWEHVDESRVHLVFDSFSMLKALIALRRRLSRGDLKA